MTKTIQTTVCRIDVKRNKRSRIDNIYTPPAGWQIVSFKPVVISNSKRASFEFALTLSHYAFKPTSAIYSKFIELLELAAEKNVFEKYQRQINQMKDDFEKYYHQLLPTYSTISTTCYFGGNKEHKTSLPEKLYLDVELTLVYLPDTEEQVFQSLDYLKQVINTEG